MNSRNNNGSERDISDTVHHGSIDAEALDHKVYLIQDLGDTTRFSLGTPFKASTNHPFCPKLKTLVSDSEVPDNVNSVYEIVINGLNQKVVKSAMAVGINAALKVPGVAKISAGNYGGKLGPFRAYLKDVLKLE